MESMNSEYEAPMSVPLDRASTATKLLEMRRKMGEVQRALDAGKKKYSDKEEIFSRREDNLRNKDLELQEALVQFNRYLKRNEKKLRQAQMAADNERKQKEQKIREIAKKRQEIFAKKKEWRRLEHMVEQNEKYKDFLQDVFQQNSKDFDQRDHIMSRYKSLKKTHAELEAKRIRIERETEELSQKLLQESKAQQVRSLELNNKYAKSSKKFEKILAEKSSEMAKIEFEEQGKAVRRMKVTSCVMSIDNLYR
uniref:DUF4200 domain-containing protein n=1 Tax=Lotharella globosa TaxID=91324 RepID=A0A7S4DL37_9EUKA